MTEFSPCKECQEPFKESEMVLCHQCDEFHCVECNGDDERTCKCEPLCGVCRQPPCECKTCTSPGCVLCMGSGCAICEEIELDKYRFMLVCDDCRVECAICRRDICFEHVNKIKSLCKITGRINKSNVCIDCTQLTLDDLIATTRSALLSAAATAAVSATATTLAEAEDENINDEQ